MENVVGKGTIGKIEEVNATYELLPRKPFTYDPATQPQTTTISPANQEQYEAINALYQALNAIQIAQSQEADRYAPEQMRRARERLQQGPRAAHQPEPGDRIHREGGDTDRGRQPGHRR